MNTSRVVRAGDSSLVVELDDRIDPDINARAVACAAHVRIAAVPGVRDVVPAFRTVTIYFDPLQTDIHRLVAVVEGASTAPDADDITPGRAIEIPVRYGGIFGPDLDDVAERARLSADEVVAIHTARAYRVFMLGFVPGFSYMGIVDERIATPRRSVPRTMVEAGSIGIAGAQTGIYPRPTPGGWNIIGRTPLAQVGLDREPPTLLAAGDMVTFRAIDESEFTRLLAAEHRT